MSKKFRITSSGAIHPDDMEAFLEYDRRPLTEEEKEHLGKCRELYDKNPIRDLSSTANFIKSSENLSENEVEAKNGGIIHDYK